MALFTIFAYKRRKPDDLGRVFAALTALGHVQPEEVVSICLHVGGREVFVHALATTTPFYKPIEQTSIVGCATLLAGYVYSYEGAEPSLLTSEQIGREFSPAQFDNLLGEYAIGHVSADGEVTALVDPDGIQNLFYVDTPDIFAVSTRPAVLAALANINFVAKPMAWISAIGYRVGTETAYDGVRDVPQGETLRWNGRLHFESRRTALHRDHGDGLTANKSWFEDRLEKSIAASGAAVQIATRNRHKIDLAITGGKDSRLVLSMCLAAGLKDRLTLYTNGPMDHPDVIVGKMIADAVGVPHRANLPGPVKTTFQDAETYIGRVSSFAFQADGLSGAWDNFLTFRTSRNVFMSGHMGEVLKAYAKRPFDPEKTTDPIDIVKLQAPFDAMGVLMPGVREQLSADLEKKFAAFISDGFTAADVPDLYYYTNRIPNWLGGLRQVHPFAQEVVMPIGVPPLMQMAFAATSHERKIERIHYEIIKRLAPPLIGIPFALQSWHSDLGEQRIDPVIMPASSTTPPFGSWQYSINHDPNIRAGLIDLIRANSSSPIWRVIDPEKLIARLGGKEFSMVELISLLGIIPSMLFSAETSAKTKIENPNRTLPPIPFSANEDAFQCSRDGWLAATEKGGLEAKGRTPAITEHSLTSPATFQRRKSSLLSRWP